MRVQVQVFQYLRVAVLGVASIVCGLGVAHSQALTLRTLSGGIEFVHVAQPLAQSTAVAWIDATVDPPETSLIVGGVLTLASDFESGWVAEDGVAASPVVVAVGAVSPDDLEALIERLSKGRPVLDDFEPAPAGFVEGITERRLASAGDVATLRLGLELPAPGDPQRNAVVVLVELLPQLLAAEVQGLQIQYDEGRVWLEARVDPEMAELTLRRVRLALARLAQDPRLSSDAVGAARRRLTTLRQAELDEASSAARNLLELWRAGGEPAVRHHLFGLAGVTYEQVREAARTWLPEHPGAAVLGLPPRVFSPRFAGPPEERRLANDMAVALLERTGSPLSVLALRPVILPDVDGDLSAIILTRLAARIRSNPAAPGWIRVRSRPPVLELAGPPEAFAELCEVLGAALRNVADDDRAVKLQGDDSRRRALQLMGDHLGLTEGTELTPAALLDPGNLAIGAVVADAEEAWEAFDKFLVAGTRRSLRPDGRSATPPDRFRVSSPGSSSTVIVDLPVALATDEPALRVAEELMKARARASELDVELLSPLVPGRRALLLAVTVEADLTLLEERLAEVWPTLMGQPSEEELAPMRRSTAALRAETHSGALGRGRLAAAIAAGDGSWQLGARDEMRVLTLEIVEFEALFAGWQELSALRITGAGALPIRSLEDGNDESR